jgi:pimeloyl-ACP methyl ester carboxylesterase
MNTFVLVHGSGHGGWCWQRVARLLRAQGAEVHTPTLSGVSDRVHLAECGIDLTTHITDVANLLFYEDVADVVLVGHSYAGFVITGVAGVVPERLRLLVFLDAYVPVPGECTSDLWSPEMRAEIVASDAAAGGMRPPATPGQMGITDPATARWAEARITPQPMATYTQPLPVGLAETVPRAYIACTQGPMTGVFGLQAQRARSAGWDVREIATGHDAMLTEPAEVARLLLDLASSAS